MEFPTPICLTCRHFDNANVDGFKCRAFPKGIPDAIIESRADHRRPYAGDNGIRYEPVEASRSADQMPAR